MTDPIHHDDDIDLSLPCSGRQEDEKKMSNDNQNGGAVLQSSQTLASKGTLENPETAPVIVNPNGAHQTGFERTHFTRKKTLVSMVGRAKPEPTRVHRWNNPNLASRRANMPKINLAILKMTTRDPKGSGHEKTLLSKLQESPIRWEGGKKWLQKSLQDKRPQTPPLSQASTQLTVTLMVVHLRYLLVTLKFYFRNTRTTSMKTSSCPRRPGCMFGMTLTHQAHWKSLLYSSLTRTTRSGAKQNT